MMNKSLIIVYSYHHNNTRQVAEKMASILKAEIITPEQISSVVLTEYDLIGFGAGIDSGHHYLPLLECAKSLSLSKSKKVFIFSTSAVQGENKVYKDHTALRNILKSKGCKVLGEFSCKGYNTNSFLRFFGGMNKSHPNEEDLENAIDFAKGLV
ncbi:flavodoxin [Acidaminobacter sp. JC074]|uniref:flavodoxin family protein n=1 Tax=Acidaminobacter sp. JC074 TaxID=2530199 RepID=UPI001F0FE4CA|nr:flavodoxin family protein [Acidaminobacter sp. JC074]MCH4888132.1 flavodoxin [Acidaminobacter sp. JC074]